MPKRLTANERDLITDFVLSIDHPKMGLRKLFPSMPDKEKSHVLCALMDCAERLVRLEEIDSQCGDSGATERALIREAVIETAQIAAKRLGYEVEWREVEPHEYLLVLFVKERPGNTVAVPAVGIM